MHCSALTELASPARQIGKEHVYFARSGEAAHVLQQVLQSISQANFAEKAHTRMGLVNK